VSDRLSARGGAAHPDASARVSRAEKVILRLFLAIDLDDGAAAGLRAWSERLRNALGSAHAGSLAFANPAQLHLTLYFLGEVVPERADALSAALAPALDVPAFAATLGALGTFPPAGAPRVAWIGLALGHEQTIAVRTALQPRLRDARLAPPADERPFFPHVTLARVRRTAKPGAGRALRAAMATLPPPQARWTVGGVTLYESLLSRDGARYIARATCALTDAPG
jgi:RNA 2',3'-cyclic 3'-phosphodiesterase